MEALILKFWLLLAAVDQVNLSPGSGVGHSVGAGSPFSTYTAGVAAFVFMAGALVAILLIGGFLVVNLGMLSKRPEDRTGKRDPSDVGILKHTAWPEAPYSQNQLPAEEEDYERKDGPRKVA
jgi:hypothetical protein